ncbi:MAG: cysteine hydrolase family protein [Methylobacter sp.]|jgi:nicotinamidase-related amidase
MSTPQNDDLHGSAPEKSPTVILIIDMINDFAFPGGDELIEHTEPIVNRIAELRKKADSKKIPVIYVNDNFGKWQSDFRTLLKHCLTKTSKSRPIVEIIKPRRKDYFVLKPKNSGFYSTTLELLLDYLQAKTLIITGLTTDVCVLLTAADAFLRDYKLLVPSDCTASINASDHEQALSYIKKVLQADTRSSDQIIF